MGDDRGGNQAGWAETNTVKWKRGLLGRRGREVWARRVTRGRKSLRGLGGQARGRKKKVDRKRGV